MAELQDDTNPETLTNQLYDLLISVKPETSRNVTAGLIHMLKVADDRTAGRALDLLRVGFSTKNFQHKQGKERPPYQYTKNFHRVWGVVSRNFTHSDDKSAFADVHPFHFVTILMEFFHTKANIELYAIFNDISNRREAREAYFEIVQRNLKIDSNKSKLVLEVATRKGQKRISGLHWDLVGGKVGEGSRFFIPPEYLREKWITVDINGVSKQFRKKGNVEFFEFPVVLSHFSHHSLDTLKVLKLASVKEVQFVCDGNIRSSKSKGVDDPVNVLYCTTGMGFPHLRTLMLSKMPLECIAFSDISSDTLTTLKIIDLSFSSCEGIWNVTEKKWKGLSLDHHFTKLSHVEVYGNAFMIDKATCPKLKHLEFGGHVMSGVPGDDNRYFVATRFPLLSVEQEETLVTLIVQDCKLSSFETMHKIGEDSQKIPRFSKLKTFNLSNLFLYNENDLKTCRYITFGDKGPTLVKFDNVTVSVGFQSGAGLIGIEDPHIQGPLSQRTAELILRRMVRCTKLTILNMPEVRNLFKVTQHMNNLDVLIVGNIGVEKDAIISKEVATRLQYIHRTPVKDKLRGVRFMPDIEAILYNKSKKNKRKEVDAKVSAGKVTSPARRPSNQIIIIISDDDEGDLEQGPTQEEIRENQEFLLTNFSKCLGSPNRSTQQQDTSIPEWMHPDILTDVGWNGQLVAWEGACVDWISGKESDTIFVEELVGEDQTIEQQPPDEGFDIGVSFPVTFNVGTMGSETRWLSMTEDTGVNPDEAYVTFYNDTFTYKTAFLSQDQLVEHYAAYQGEGPSPKQRARESLDTRATLFSSVTGERMNLELNLRRLPRHLGWILAGADVNVELNIDQIGIPSVTDGAEFAITIGPYRKPGSPGEHFDKGYVLVPSQGSATVFDINYIDDNLRRNMNSPVDDKDNKNFSFRLGGLELDQVGDTGVLRGFTINIPCRSLMKIVGLQSLEILCFTTEEQNKMITSASRSPQIADDEDEEDEEEEWQEGQDELALDLVQQAANRSGIEATPLDIKMNKDGMPNDPPVRVRIVPNDVTMYKVARGILSRTRNTVLGAMIETPVSNDNESSWHHAEFHESRHFTPSALVLCYFMGRGMLEILNMEDIRKSPMFEHFSIVYNAHWVPLMRWCTQTVPKSLGHTLGTGFQKHQDTERLMSIASGQWSGKRERQDRRATSLKIYGRGFVALKNLVETMSELMEDTSRKDWRIIDTAYKKAFALYLTLSEIVLHDGEGDMSKTKRSMTTATNKAFKGIKTFFESIWGSLDEQVETMLEDPSPGVAPTTLSFGLELAKEEEEGDVPTLPSSPASPGVIVVQKSSAQRASTVTETVQDTMEDWDAFVVRRKQQQKTPEQADTEIILHLTAQEEIPGLAIPVVTPQSSFTTPRPKKTRSRRKKAVPKKNVGIGKEFSHQTLKAPTEIVPITPPPAVSSTRATKRRAQKSPSVSPEQLKAPQFVSTKKKVVKRIKAREDSPTSVMIQTPMTQKERGLFVLEAIARRETVSKISPVRSLGGTPQQFPGRAPPPVLLQDVTRRTREDELRDELFAAKDREIDLLRQLLAAKTQSEKEKVKKRRRDIPPDTPPSEFKKPPPGGGFFSTSTNAKICANCSDEAENRCSKCKAVFYCGRECQMDHYAKHVHECK